MSRTKKAVLIAGCMLLMMVVAFGGFITSVKSDGERRQQALQDDYNSMRDSVGRCIRDGFSQTTLSGGMVDLFEDDLVFVAMTEFVNNQGDSIEKTSEVVFNEVVNVMVAWGDFTVEEITGLSDLVAVCGGSSSSVYDSAVKFQEWIDGASLFDQMARGQFPTDDLEVTTGLETTASGSSALDLLTRTVNQYTGSSLDNGAESA